MASYQVGPEVLPGRVGAVPLTDHVDHGMAATLSWQGSHGNRRSVTASSWRADERRYRTAPPQLRTKGNSGIIKGGCAERKMDLAPATDRNRFSALEYLARINARGGTEMAEPLLQAAERLIGKRADHQKRPAREQPGRDAILVLVTDGQVGNEDQILQALAPELGGIRVFTLGIDRAVNEAFLRRLAELGRGRCELVESENRLDEVMEAIHRQIGTPLLTDLALEPEGFTIEPDSLVPERLPDLFAGAPLLVLGRFQGQPAGRLAVRARAAAGLVWCQALEGNPRDNPAIASAWARGQVRKLEDRYVVAAEDLGALERQIVALSLRFGVLSRFAAYVAIDHAETANKGGKLHRITQPVESPQGWAMRERALRSMFLHDLSGKACIELNAVSAAFDRTAPLPRTRNWAGEMPCLRSKAVSAAFDRTAPLPRTRNWAVALRDMLAAGAEEAKV